MKHWYCPDRFYLHGEGKNVVMAENNGQIIIKYTNEIADFFFRSLYIVAE